MSWLPRWKRRPLKGIKCKYNGSSEMQNFQEKGFESRRFESSVDPIKVPELHVRYQDYQWGMNIRVKSVPFQNSKD